MCEKRRAERTQQVTGGNARGGVQGSPKASFCFSNGVQLCRMGVERLHPPITTTRRAAASTACRMATFIIGKVLKRSEAIGQT